MSSVCTIRSVGTYFPSEYAGYIYRFIRGENNMRYGSLFNVITVISGHAPKRNGTI